MPVSKTPWILPALLALLAAPAAATGTASEAEARSDVVILHHADAHPVDASWLSGQLNRVHLHKKRGFAYTRSFDRRDRGLEWSVQGPAIGGRKAIGIGIELRF